MTYLPIPSQASIGETWIEAVRALLEQPSREASNVILGITNPNSHQLISSNVYTIANDFLSSRAKPINTVANTIFPADLYFRYKQKGAKYFCDRFNEKILPLVRKDRRWSGYYFERMTHVVREDKSTFNPLLDVIERINDPTNNSKNKFEVSAFDPARDVTGSPYGGQCLSHLSFKLVHATGGGQDRLNLTATYRNHYYIEKLLGNLLGLTRLMEFISEETQTPLGGLTVISTHAKIDHPGKATMRDIHTLMNHFV